MKRELIEEFERLLAAAKERMLIKQAQFEQTSATYIVAMDQRDSASKYYRNLENLMIYLRGEAV